MANPHWLEYEREVSAEFAAKFRDATVVHNTSLPGIRSGVERQIDTLISIGKEGSRTQIVVEAKRHTRPIDVKHVEAFIGVLGDVQVARGIMVSASGYTRAAVSRAFRDDVDLDLDIFSLAELKLWQGFAGIPYAGDRGLVVPSPVGWIVDASRARDTLAQLYRRGLDAQKAWAIPEIMYLNFWNPDPQARDLDGLIALQNRRLRAKSNQVVITTRDVASHRGMRACIRRADVPQYPSAEITGFVEFRDFIAFVVLFTPLAIERRNVRKLEYVLEHAVPIAIDRA